MSVNMKFTLEIYNNTVRCLMFFSAEINHGKISNSSNFFLSYLFVNTYKSTKYVTYHTDTEQKTIFITQMFLRGGNRAYNPQCTRQSYYQLSGDWPVKYRKLNYGFKFQRSFGYEYLSHLSLPRSRVQPSISLQLNICFLDSLLPCSRYKLGINYPALFVEPANWIQM